MTTTVDDEVGRTAPRRPDSGSWLWRAGRARGAWLLRTLLAAVSGLAMWGAFPPGNQWYLAIVSLGVLYATLGVDPVRVRTGAWLGFVFGLAFFLPLLPWIGVYVGPLPWIALSVALGVYLALFGAIATLTMRLPVPPIWFALSWLLVEATRSAFPFGGFPWGRAAFSQVGGPLLPLASLVGVPGVSFAVALVGASLVWLVHVVVRRRRPADDARPACDGGPVRRGRSVLGVGALALALVGPIAAIAATPSTNNRTTSTSTAQVAAVQGNVPRLGLDFNSQRRAVLDNHVRESQQLGAAIRDHRIPQPDFVAWPEDASDISPLANPDAADEITATSESVGAPIMVGTLLANSDGRPTNTILTWDGSRGPVGRYDKHIVQPFGEYLPWRPFFRLFSSYADLAGNFRPGSGPSVLQVPGRTGDVTVGVATCWEVAFDRAARSSVHDGAQILYVPTNNATFGHTDMTYQQLAMSRFRAVEHGRAVVVAATSGVSALIDADGRVEQQSGIFTPAVLSARLPLQSGETVATRLGEWPELVAIVVALGGLLVALARRTRFTQKPRRARGSDADPARDSANMADKAEERGGDRS